MKELFKLVGEFNEAFGVSEHVSPQAKIKDEDKFLYHRLMEEEVEEYMDAVIANDTIEVADALADELYILIGKFRKHGISGSLAAELFNEVHRSNMSKLGEDGKPVLREDGKITKGPNYFKPELGIILDEHAKEHGL